MSGIIEKDKRNECKTQKLLACKAVTVMRKNIFMIIWSRHNKGRWIELNMMEIFRLDQGAISWYDYLNCEKNVLF